MANAKNNEESKAQPEAENVEAAAENNRATAPVFVSIPEEELRQLKEEIKENKDKYLRQLAETDNMRKRLQKERQEMVQYAIQNVICDFLTPIDQFENALKFTQNMSDEVKHWALGFQMILTQFKDVLSNNGVTAFHSEGTPFDPHCHEAVEMVDSKDHAPGHVVEESLRGYKMGGKTIRPARVKVAKEPQKEEQNNENLAE